MLIAKRNILASPMHESERSRLCCWRRCDVSRGTRVFHSGSADVRHAHSRGRPGVRAQARRDGVESLLLAHLQPTDSVHLLMDAAVLTELNDRKDAEEENRSTCGSSRRLNCLHTISVAVADHFVVDVASFCLVVIYFPPPALRVYVCVYQCKQILYSDQFTFLF